MISHNTTKDEMYTGFYSSQFENGIEYSYLTILPTNRIAVQTSIRINDIPVWNVVFLLMFFILFVGICIIMSYYLASTIRKPLKQLTNGMDEICSLEHASRLEFKAKAEFEEIKESFNLLIERLENEKVANLKNEMQKKKLLLDLSHDIKTPVATIKSYTDALKNDLVVEEKKKEIYGIIDRKAERVTQLLSDMFLMMKMDQSEYTIKREKVEIEEFIRTICVEYYDEIEKNRFDFVIDIPETHENVWIDLKLFQRVIC